MKVLSGTGNVRLSKEIAKRLKVKLVNTNIKRFSDGEIYVEINENIEEIVFLLFNLHLIPLMII